MKVDVLLPDGAAASVILDDGGRAVVAEKLVAGTYEIRFHAADYQGGEAFYDFVPVRFNVRDITQHYHIPLILSPFGYSTYRGG